MASFSRKIDSIGWLLYFDVFKTYILTQTLTAKKCTYVKNVPNSLENNPHSNLIRTRIQSAIFEKKKIQPALEFNPHLKIIRKGFVNFDLTFR